MLITLLSSTSQVLMHITPSGRICLEALFAAGAFSCRSCQHDEIHVSKKICPMWRLVAKGRVESIPGFGVVRLK